MSSNLAHERAVADMKPLIAWFKARSAPTRQFALEYCIVTKPKVFWNHIADLIEKGPYMREWNDSTLRELLMLLMKMEVAGELDKPEPVVVQEEEFAP